MILLIKKEVLRSSQNLRLQFSNLNQMKFLTKTFSFYYTDG